MKPFAGYNFADYWAHWLKVGSVAEESTAHLPRQLVPPENAGGEFLWPGFGENLRVLVFLAWILDRCAGNVGALDMPIGKMPRGRAISTPPASTSAARRWRN